MKTKNQKPTVILHGEAMIFPCEDIPSASTMKKKVRSKTQTFVIIAPSEMTGNHHVVDLDEGVEFWEDFATGKLYMKNSKPATVRCLVKERHDAVEIPAGTWEFGIQQEYDYMTDSLKKVAD